MWVRAEQESPWGPAWGVGTLNSGGFMAKGALKVNRLNWDNRSPQYHVLDHGWFELWSQYVHKNLCFMIYLCSSHRNQSVRPWHQLFTSAHSQLCCLGCWCIGGFSPPPPPPPTAAFTLSHPPFLPVSVVIGGRVLRLLGDEESVAACLSVRALRDIRRERLLLAASTHRTMDQFDAVKEACLWGTAALWFYVIWPPGLVNITCLIGAITEGMCDCGGKGIFAASMKDTDIELELFFTQSGCIMPFDVEEFHADF